MLPLSLEQSPLHSREYFDEPFAWDSREYLRKLCIGKDVVFGMDYAIPSTGREFGSVFIGDKNVALLIVSKGWAEVRQHGQQKIGANPYLSELIRLKEKAKAKGLGLWSMVPGAQNASIRDLPPSAIGDPSNFDPMGLLAIHKGKPMQCIVEMVHDGSTIRVFLLLEFQFVQVYVARVQAPFMGKRAPGRAVTTPKVVKDAPNGEAPAESRNALTTAQKLAASTTSFTVAPDFFGREAKHFTESRALNRDVRVVLEGVDNFSNLIGSVYYSDSDATKDLALKLVKNVRI